jgi:hypothetical protein
MSMKAPRSKRITSQRSSSVSDCFHFGMTVPGTPSLTRQKKKASGRPKNRGWRRSAGRALFSIAYGPSPLPAQPWQVRHLRAYISRPLYQFSTVTSFGCFMSA